MIYILLQGSECSTSSTGIMIKRGKLYADLQSDSENIIHRTYEKRNEFKENEEIEKKKTKKNMKVNLESERQCWNFWNNEEMGLREKDIHRAYSKQMWAVRQHWNLSWVNKRQKNEPVR